MATVSRSRARYLIVDAGRAVALPMDQVRAIGTAPDASDTQAVSLRCLLETTASEAETEIAVEIETPSGPALVRVDGIRDIAPANWEERAPKDSPKRGYVVSLRTGGVDRLFQALDLARLLEHSIVPFSPGHTLAKPTSIETTFT